MTRPGARLRSIATRFFDRSTMTRVIEPAIADLQHEHDDAIRRGLRFRRRRVQAAGYVGVWKVIAASATIASTRALGNWARADEGAVGRTIAYSFGTITTVAALLMGPPLRNVPEHVSPNEVGWMVLYTVPQALVVAIPMGLVVGTLSGLRGRVATKRVRRSLTAMAIVWSLVTFVLVAWMMPAANQAFRELMAGHRVARGFNEMTLGELARTPTQNLMLVSATANRLAFEFHFRLALAFASLPLGLFAIGVASAWRGAYRVRSIVVVGFLTGFAYYALLFWVRQAGYAGDEQAGAAIAWTPNLVFLAITLLLFRGPLTGDTQ